MDPIDLEIQKRLDKLKEPLQNLPSEDELKKRLNDLKETPIITDINNKVCNLPILQNNISILY